MSYFVRHLHGRAESDYPLAQLDALLDELLQADGEHVQVELVHDSEWSIAVSRSGRITFENVESNDEIYHMDSVSKPRAIELMTRLARGEIESLLQERWTRGYG
jgi:hypothetical protein